ncbi:MAG TPA: AMP-binding protein [Vicinamibacterales bacterium]|jgi:fatty-acyl-CoA synthase|nr:AMP-binding protein [Vicinamibacterales bacterium]
MQSYVHGSALTPLLGQTIGDSLNRAAAEFSQRDALISCHQNLRYTYSELLHHVNRAARALLNIGVARGDRVGIWSPNTAEWMIIQFAAAKVGAILVNINPSYQLRELEYALNQSGLTVLISARKFRKSDYVGMLESLMPELKQLRTGPVTASRIPSLHHLVYLGSESSSGAMTWSDFIARGDGVDDATLAARERMLQFDDPINIQYTSGTTGSPKGATLSHHNILNNGFFVGEVLKYTEADRICVPVPFYHCFGCVMANLAAVTHGAAVVIPAEAFDAEATLQAIAAHHCTSIYGVPTMFIAQLEHPAFGSACVDSLRTGIMAGAPCPIEVMKQVMERMHVPEITICYGMTETSPVSFQSAVDDAIDVRVSTVGAVHPHLECKIIDPATGEIVPRGTAGELCTRGYSVMLGYWDNPDATAEAIDAARWMHTGDIAAMRDDGYVNISGRIKDMIIRGGENIYPREIEEFLYSHPKVSDVQVIGVPDVKYGEEVCAWVRLRHGDETTEDELRAYCRGQIANYKIPRYIRFTTDFPTTVTGKIQKFRMREISIAELGLGQAEAVRTA